MPSDNEIIHYDVNAVARVSRVRYLKDHILTEKDFYIGLLQRAAATVVREYGRVNVVMLAKFGGQYILHLDDNIWEFRNDEQEARLLAGDIAWFVIYTFSDARRPPADGSG